MIRLSKKAWNNVLIFSVMFMILLFNSTSDILNSSSEDSPLLPLVESEQVIMTIDFGPSRIERIGQGWRLSPASDVSETDLAELIARWQTTQLMLDTSVPDGQPMVVVLWLAGQANGRVYQFLPDAEAGDRVKIDNQWYRLQDRSLAELVPSGVL